jgi:hypothetical protein
MVKYNGLPVTGAVLLYFDQASGAQSVLCFMSEYSEIPRIFTSVGRNKTKQKRQRLAVLFSGGIRTQGPLAKAAALRINLNVVFIFRCSSSTS